MAKADGALITIAVAASAAAKSLCGWRHLIAHGIGERGTAREKSGLPWTGMRRLLLLASAVVFVDTAFFSAIVPLLPDLRADLGLTKTAAGILSGSYAAGTLVAALPAGLLAARIGGRNAVLGGLSVMVLTSAVFAFAESIVLLDGTRFIQGAGSALSWAGALGWLVSAAPRERRGALIGSTVGAAIAGTLLGPALGGFASAVGRDVAFSAFAVGGLGLILITVRMPPPRRVVAGGGIAALRMAARSPSVRFGMLMILVPGMLFGAIDVLVPLELGEFGAGAGAIAGVFIAAAAIETVVAPVAGRLSDRHGRVAPLAVGLVLSAGFMLLLALPDRAWVLGALLVIGAPVVGIMWSPAMALLSDGAEARGVDQALAFGVVNLGWGMGHTTGAVAGPALGQASSDAVAYVALAGVCVAALAALLTARPAALA